VKLQSFPWLVLIALFWSFTCAALPFDRDGGISISNLAILRSDRLTPAGATYYVATDGKDINNGSLGAPWATLQHAADQVQPGDTILVQSGTYRGLRIERSGMSSAWITLKAAPGASVLVNQPGTNNKHTSDIEVETWNGTGVVAYWIIEGFEVTSAPYYGIDIRGSDHITVRGNKVHNNGVSAKKTGIFAAFADDLWIENNESYANGEHGIYVSNSSDRFTVRGNQLHNNAGCGVHMNGDLSMGGDGIESNGLVENNIIYENGTSGGAGINMDGVEKTIVRNNLLYNNHASGIAIYNTDGAICSQNNQFLFNTIVMPSNGRWAITIGGAGCVNNKIFNNILYNSHSFRGSINLAAGTVSGFQSDYNIVVDRFSTNDGNSILTLSQWKALGYDTHSFVATPAQLFSSPVGNDYHLLLTSPAIDAGRSDLGIFADLENHSRPSGAGYDIGAYEYQFPIVVGPPQAYLPLVIHP